MGNSLPRMITTRFDSATSREQFGALGGFVDVFFGSLQSKSHQVRSIRGFSSKRLSIGRVVTGREHRTHISRAGEALLQRYAMRPWRSSGVAANIRIGWPSSRA